MATITYSITGGTEPDVTYTRAEDDANVTRVHAWLADIYGPYTDENGDPQSRTSEEQWNEAARATWGSTMKSAERHEEQTAARAAADAVPPIVPVRNAWEKGFGYVEGSAVSHGGTNYNCTQQHTGSPGTEPGSGGAWQNFWAVA